MRSFPVLWPWLMRVVLGALLRETEPISDRLAGGWPATASPRPESYPVCPSGPQYCRVIPAECRRRTFAASTSRTSLKRRPASVRRGEVAIVNKRRRGGDRPELLDPVAADSDIPVVEVDGQVAVARHEADLVADAQPVGGARDPEPAVLVGGALISAGGLVPDERRTRVEGECLQSGVD